MCINSAYDKKVQYSLSIAFPRKGPDTNYVRKFFTNFGPPSPIARVCKILSSRPSLPRFSYVRLKIGKGFAKSKCNAMNSDLSE